MRPLKNAKSNTANSLKFRQLSEVPKEVDAFRDQNP